MTAPYKIIRRRGMRIMLVQPSDLLQIVNCWRDTHVMPAGDVVDGYACYKNGVWSVAEAQTGECCCEDFQSLRAVVAYLAGDSPEDIRARDHPDLRETRPPMPEAVA